MSVKNSQLNLQNVDLSMENFHHSCFSARSKVEKQINDDLYTMGLVTVSKAPFDEDKDDDFDAFSRSRF